MAVHRPIRSAATARNSPPKATPRRLIAPKHVQPRPSIKPPAGPTIIQRSVPATPRQTYRPPAAGPHTPRIPPMRRDFERVAPPRRPASPPAKGDPPPVATPKPKGPVFRPPGF